MLLPRCVMISECFPWRYDSLKRHFLLGVWLFFGAFMAFSMLPVTSYAGAVPGEVALPGAFKWIRPGKRFLATLLAGSLLCIHY